MSCNSTIHPVQESEVVSETSLPQFEDIHDVELHAFYRDRANQISEIQFKEIISSGKIVDEFDPILKYWHYAPWYNGRFKTSKGTFLFHLFLGRLGSIATPSKKIIYFRFTVP